MATIKTALYSRLSGYAGLTALTSTRIYPKGSAPQSATAPFIEFGEVSEVRNHAMSADTRKVRARYQFDIYAASQDSAEAVRTQLQAALNRYRGTSDTVVIDEAMLSTSTDGVELPSEYGKRYVVSQDYVVWFTEP